MQAEKKRKYLYAIVLGAQALPEHPGDGYQSAGLYGGRVYCVPEGRIAAVVSDVPASKFRAERRHLAAHHQVQRTLLSEGRTLLPVAFGIITDDAHSLRRILALNEDAFYEQLRHVEGKVEMGLRVTWDVPNIFQYMVDTHPDLGGLRNRLFAGGREPTQDEKVALGRRFEQVLDSDRTAHTESVRRVLAEVCSETKENDPRDENEVMNLACLIRRNAQNAFEGAVLEAARLFNDDYAFDYTGPWPPYNFVEIEIET
jgi:hypothetical protein